MTLSRQLVSLALRHDGVLTAADFRSHGQSRAAVRRHVARGELISAGHGIHRLTAHPFTHRTRIRVATLRAGRRGVLSGYSASWWWGIVEQHPPLITVTMPPGDRQKRLPATRIRYRCLAAADVTSLSGLAITSAPLTVLEAGVEHGIDVVDAALLHNRVTESQLQECYARRRGCEDAGTMGTILALVGTGGRSVAERMAINIFTANGITGWVAGHPVGGYLLDFAFPDLRIGIEIDGMAYHHTARAFQHDRTRGNDLSGDWRILHFTYGDLLNRPDDVAARVKGAVSSAATRAA